MSRILAQPIYRDALLVGKFLAGLATLAVFLVALWLFMMGLGMLLIGLPPSGAFLAKWQLLSSAIALGQWLWVPVVAAGSLMAAGYVFRLLGFVLPVQSFKDRGLDALDLAPALHHHESSHDVKLKMVVVIFVQVLFSICTHLISFLC